MKGNEEASAKALEQLLLKLGLTCSWAPVTPSNSFPDFDFLVQDEKWAVECTDLHQYIDHDGSPSSRIGVDKGLERLCEEIRTKSNPGLNRKYLITALGPSFNVDRKEIVNRAIEYIAGGRTEREALDLPEFYEQDTAEANLRRLVAENQTGVRIEALLEKVPIVYSVGLHGTVMNADHISLAADIPATLRFAVRRILDEKLPKLAQCKHYQRRILLVWRGFSIAEPSQIKKVLDEINLSKSDLDTFLLVLPNGEISWPADPGELFG